MIYRIYPFQDTFITNDVAPGTAVRMTASNFGASEELAVFKRSGVSGAIGTMGSSSLGRTLMQFDFSAYTALTASGDLPATSSSYILRLAHKTHDGLQPSSFDINVVPLTVPWDEGLGQDVSNYGDVGFANWSKPKSTDTWLVPGGTFLAGPFTASAHFDTGVEDLKTDVTSIVNLWLHGSASNYGIMLMMSPNIESDSNYSNYYTKKFYSRNTHYQDRGPYVEVRSTDYIRDDRANMRWGRTGSLYLYNFVGDVLQDLPTLPTVSISDLSGVLLSMTASHGTTGIYSASFSLTSGTIYSGSVFYDSWSNGTVGSFILQSAGSTVTPSARILTARVRNTSNEYNVEDVVDFEVFFRKKNHTSPVLTSASLGVAPHIVEQGYYAIENDATRDRIIDFGTGSLQHTRMSYDGNGNRFRFYMNNLSAGNVYRIIFLTYDQGHRTIIDPDVTFKVV
jgi:hypothetical protein